MKIPLSKEPSTRPMTVAYIPGEKKYYIADGGLSPVGNEPFSKSQVHVYDDKGPTSNHFPQVLIIAQFITMKILKL